LVGSLTPNFPTQTIVIKVNSRQNDYESELNFKMILESVLFQTISSPTNLKFSA